MEAAERIFPPQNKYGVFGFGIGSKRKKGAYSGYNTLTVFITRKYKNPENRIPPVPVSFSEGDFFVIPDIIASGHAPKINNSKKLPFNGLHPGSVIRPEWDRSYSYGGVACILSSNREPDFLLTAGHLFPPGAQGTLVYAGDSGFSGKPCGELVHNLLDHDYGSSNIDAALVQLNEDGKMLVHETTGDGPYLQGIDTLEIGRTGYVQAFLPNSNDYSDVVEVRYHNFTIYINEPLRDRDLVIRSSLLTRFSISRPGDSGTILFSRRESKGAVGICVGEWGTHSIFEPIGRAIRILRQQYPGLELYNSQIDY
jgi:hypothetical protein